MSFDDWIESRRESLNKAETSEWTVVGRKIQGIISWNVNDTCNYRCSYCTQRFMADRTGFLEDERLELVLKSFSQLNGAWEIKLSGGEPFRQPSLNELARRLVLLGHCVSIQTNFSAPEEKIKGFLEATRGALHLFSASLHLEYDSAESFIQRYEWIRPYERFGVQFHVTSVGAPARLQQLRDEIAPLFLGHGIALKVQPEKVNGYVRNYSEEEKAILLELGGHNHTGKIANNFQGRMCRSGSRYLVIKSNGEAFRCYPASRLGGQFARIGSLQTGLQLLDGPQLCPYTYCNCTVPIQRGMIEGQLPLPLAIDNSGD